MFFFCLSCSFLLTKKTNGEYFENQKSRHFYYVPYISPQLLATSFFFYIASISQTILCSNISNI